MDVLSSSHKEELLRRLPSVEALADRATDLPHALAVSAARLAVANARRRVLAGETVELGLPALESALRIEARELSAASLRPVINATGVILHTNLGRAPLAAEAAAASALAAASYTNLEYDLEGGGRGSRNDHVEPALRELAGTEAALAVNNNAAAVLLALASLGGGEVVVSRGELVEIGGSFRIPDVLAQSGAELVEVGTTNRTRIGDYERAIGSRTAALLRVHQSNFRIEGFTEQPSLEQLCRLGVERGLTVIDDLGSGALEPIAKEPTLGSSVRAGATLICCSADKLLGGPQAGLLVGQAEAIERCRRHPLARAVRIDKMQLAALEATLRLHRFGEAGAIPTLAMLSISGAELRTRAERLAAGIGEPASIIRSTSAPGGGSLPGTELEGPACAVDPAALGADQLATRLREGDPPVLARIADGLVLLDPRTIETADLNLTARLVRSALAA